jgi:hypothetical protein
MTSLYKGSDEYVLAAIERVQTAGSRITDFTGGSGARTLYEGLAAELSLQSAVTEQLRQDSYLATATGDALDRKALDYGVVRKVAVAAVGTVRLTRLVTTGAANVPAGWGTLLTPPATGQQPVAFITTAAAALGIGTAFVVVAAQAVEGGVSGNIAINTKLLPQNPVNGFDTDGGFKAEIAFTGGVDVETDEQLRARVPIEVQGRVKGTPAALLAAALRVPGVESASVILAGETRDAPLSSTVAGGQAEVYYEGAASLLTSVTSEVANAAIAGQGVTVLQATPIDITADLVVFCLAGTDTAALGLSVANTVMTTVNAVGVDAIARASNVVSAVHAIADAISVNVPFTDLRRTFEDPNNTFGDISCGNNAYPVLTLAGTTVLVTTL